MNDLKFAVRQLLKNPGFAAVAILTLALGIGANTAVFTVTDALILRALPVLEPRQLVLFGNAGSMGSTDGIPGGSVQLFSYPMYRQLKEGNHVFSNVAAMKSLILDFHGRVQSRGELEKLRVQLVSGSYFPLLGILPAAGRLLTEDDDRIPGGHPVAVVAQSWWTQHFGKEPFQPGRICASMAKGIHRSTASPTAVPKKLAGVSPTIV